MKTKTRSVKCKHVRNPQKCDMWGAACYGLICYFADDRNNCYCDIKQTKEHQNEKTD